VSTEAREAAYLRTIIEKQPFCLLRVARTGTLLACNDAGLRLLGKTAHVDVLDRTFEEHVLPDQLTSWREFVNRVWAREAGSIECELGTGSERKDVLLQAIALRNHPDGIESMLIAARDVSSLHRLEAALQNELRLQQRLTETEGQLAAAVANRQILVEELERVRAELRAEQEAAGHKLTEISTQLQRALDEQQQLTRRLEESRTDQQQLTDAIHQRDEALHKLDVERQRVGEAHRLEQSHLSTLAETLDQELPRLKASRVEFEAKQSQAETDREALQARLKQVEADRNALNARLEQTDAEGKALQARLGQAEADGKATEARLVQAETERKALQTRLGQAEADGKALEARLVQAEADRETMDARLVQSDADQKTMDARLAQAQADRESLQARLVHAEGDQEALNIRLVQVGAEGEAARAHLAATRADLESAKALLQGALADLGALEQVRDERDAVARKLREVQALHASERRRFEATQASLRAAIERDVAKEREAEAREVAEVREMAKHHERELVIKERERIEVIANLQAELALAVADQRRLQTLLARAEADQQRLAATQSADRAAAERSLGEVSVAKSQLLKALADERIELQQWRDTACSLEPLAAAGRIAVQLAREMHDLVASLDDRARVLLSTSQLDSTSRTEIEALRADAMRAVSLVRQLARANAGRASGETA